MQEGLLLPSKGATSSANDAMKVMATGTQHFDTMQVIAGLPLQLSQKEEEFNKLVEVAETGVL